MACMSALPTPYRCRSGRPAGGASGAGTELVDDPGLGRGLARGPASGERGGRDGADDVDVAFGLASDQHAVTMARRRPGLQPDFGLPVFIAAAAKVAVDPVTLSHRG